jgi:tetratricopeptide (TPR) repeat protein
MAEGLVLPTGGLDDERAFLSQCYLKTGRLRNGIGKTTEATASFERARVLLQQLADANPSITRFQRDLARAQIAIGFQCSQNGDPTGAMAAYQQSLALRRKLAEAWCQFIFPWGDGHEVGDGGIDYGGQATRRCDQPGFGRNRVAIRPDLGAWRRGYAWQK